MTKNLTTPSTDQRRETDQRNAVKFRKAYKTFVTKNDACIVLRNLNMTVPKGTIYGLMGPSSCGKTTLLNCIVGRRKLDSGELWVLRDGKNVTKPRIGFMPQQMALHQELSIWESMRHYGWLIGMRTQSVMAKAQFLVELLELPNINQRIGTLDHGNKKLVSFAIVLLLEPELLILDEPTVGLDPMLRDTIWKHLKEITRECRVTVVFTTHYAEEVKDADIVGFMRKGRLMVEDQPQAVLSRFHASTFEKTFRKLSEMQDAVTASHNKTTFLNFSLETDYSARFKVSDYLTVKSKQHCKALMWKNFIWIFRNWWLMMTLLGVPILQCLLFFICFGHAPRALNVAFVNLEEHCAQVPCKGTGLGCHYLKYLNSTFVNLVKHESESSAIESVLRGKSYASIVIKANYTSELQVRMENWQYASEKNMLESTLHVYRDSSNLLKMFLQDSYAKFIAEFLQACGKRRSEVLYPFQWKTPFYDLLLMELGDFASPGVLLTTIFLLPAGLGAVTMLTDKNEGTFDRCISLGVRPLEMLCSHAIADFAVALGLCASMFASLAYVFGVAIKGSYALLVVLVALTCFCGLWFGYLLASVCRSVACVFLVTLGSFFPLTYLCGILWPIQGMPAALQHVSYALPLTLPTETLRNIIKNNWKLSRPAMYQGFVAISAWACIFAAICILITRRLK